MFLWAWTQVRVLPAAVCCWTDPHVQRVHQLHTAYVLPTCDVAPARAPVHHRYQLLCCICALIVSVTPPITSMCAFITRMSPGVAQVPMGYKVAYAARALCALAVYEVFLHYFFIGAIANQPMLHHVLFNSPLPCVTYAYVGVNFLYLKFLAMWRFFRMWAVLDDIVPPENVSQCSDCTSARMFWAAWILGWMSHVVPNSDSTSRFGVHVAFGLLEPHVAVCIKCVAIREFST